MLQLKNTSYLVLLISTFHPQDVCIALWLQNIDWSRCLDKPLSLQLIISFVFFVLQIFTFAVFILVCALHSTENRRERRWNIYLKKKRDPGKLRVCVPHNIHLSGKHVLIWFELCDPFILTLWGCVLSVVLSDFTVEKLKSKPVTFVFLRWCISGLTLYNWLVLKKKKTFTHC